MLADALCAVSVATPWRARGLLGLLHASSLTVCVFTAGVAAYLSPKVSGFLMKKELDYLGGWVGWLAGV